MHALHKRYHCNLLIKKTTSKKWDNTGKYKLGTRHYKATSIAKQTTFDRYGLREETNYTKGCNESNQ